MGDTQGTLGYHISQDHLWPMLATFCPLLPICFQSNYILSELYSEVIMESHTAVGYNEFCMPFIWFLLTGMS